MTICSLVISCITAQPFVSFGSLTLSDGEVCSVCFHFTIAFALRYRTPLHGCSVIQRNELFRKSVVLWKMNRTISGACGPLVFSPAPMFLTGPCLFNRKAFILRVSPKTDFVVFVTFFCHTFWYGAGYASVALAGSSPKSTAKNRHGLRFSWRTTQTRPSVHAQPVNAHLTTPGLRHVVL